MINNKNTKYMFISHGNIARLKIVSCLLLLLLTCSAPLFSQSFTFKHIETKDGLSHVTVNDIWQDELGRMWFATRDGLNLYDGNDVKVFRPEPDDANAIPFSKIQNVVGDNEGHLYLRSETAFVVFDMKREIFRTIVNNGVKAIAVGKKGIWLYANNSLFLYNIATQKLQLYHTMENGFIATYLYEDSKGVCWMSSMNGLLSLDQDKTSKKYLPGAKIRKVMEDSKQNLWVLTYQHLVKYTPQGAMCVYKHKDGDLKSLLKEHMRVVCEDSLGYIWFGSQQGLNRFDPSTEKFESFLPAEGNTSSISDRSITSLYTDKQGTVWIGTYFGGINYLNPENQVFRLFYPQKGGLTSSVVGKMAEDKRGVIWICTEGGGLCAYDPQTGKIESYPKEMSGISETNLKEIWYDKAADCLWLGSHSYDINRFDLKTKRSKVYTAELFKNSNTILPYGNKLLLGCAAGVYIFDPETEAMTPFLPEEAHLRWMVNMMTIDSRNRLWVATTRGLTCYDFNNRTLSLYEHQPESPTSLSANAINVVFEDSRQRIWVGTNGFGLNLFRPETNNFLSFTKKKNGLIDNNIVAIKEAKSGKILIGTNKGLAVCNMKDTTFVGYDHQQGFPLTGINEYSLFIAGDGKIYVGGVDGMSTFVEEGLVSYTPKHYNIVFSRLYVNNIEVVEGDETGILSESIPFAEEIRLKPKYSVFSVEFMTDNYINTDQSAVEYRLHGYESQWMKARGHTLTFTNLSPDKYFLELRATDFPSVVKSLTIVIEPPFYQTWEAYLIYLVLAAVLVIWLWRETRTRFFLKTSLEFERNEKERNAELTQAKLRFFTNISHEFRTPITLILGQTEMLLNTSNVHPTVYSRILNIHKNANNLKALISELLDFRKQEQGYVKLRISCLDLIAFLDEIFVTFKAYAATNNIDLQYKHVQSAICLWFDPEQMQKVVNNLLSNAFKYTKPGGVIQIAVKEWDNDVEFSVSDNGQGISSDDLQHVFDRFYQVNTVEGNSGTGIGLALAKGIVDAHAGEINAESVCGEGSVFTVRLKKDDMHFKGDTKRVEIVEEIAYYNRELPDKTFIHEMKQSQETAHGGDLTILIVEDNNDLRNLLADVFSPLYKVITAEDGAIGWEKVQEQQPDIVVTDIMMPKLSGTELCEKIKETFETSHIPVVLLTAKTAVEHKFEGLRIGADDYITKPFDLKLLILRCNNLVNNRRMLQRRFINTPDFNTPEIATNNADSELLRKATDVVLANIQNERFDIDAFSREMNLGRTSLFNKLKAVTGLPPNQFFVNIRLKKAAEMLIHNPDMNISEIAYATGFSNAHYFNHCFKEQFGMAPSNYRKNH